MYKLIGFIEINRDATNGFVVPVFDFNRSKYVCEIDEYHKIVNFNRIDSSMENFVNDGNHFIRSLNLHCKKNDDNIYLFKIGNEFIKGSKENMITKLTEWPSDLINELDLFGRYDLYSFLGLTAKAERIKFDIKKQYGVDLLELEFEKVNHTAMAPSQLFDCVKSILKNSGYKNILGDTFKGFFSEISSSLRLGQYLVNKDAFDKYLESKQVLASLDSRYSVEAYIMMKKQCGGSIKPLEKAKIISTGNLSTVPVLPSLYYNATLGLEWNLKKDEIPIINALSSRVNIENQMESPAVLNTRFENKMGRVYDDDIIKTSESISSKKDLDDIKNLVMTINS